MAKKFKDLTFSDKLYVLKNPSPGVLQGFVCEIESITKSGIVFQDPADPNRKNVITPGYMNESWAARSMDEDRMAKFWVTIDQEGVEKMYSDLLKSDELICEQFTALIVADQLKK